MAYDQDLANRVRELFAREENVTEMSMFGGLAFLLQGNMAVAVSSKGGLMLRCDPGDVQAALARPHTAPMIMRGRPAKGWLRVSADGVASKRQLESWVRRGCGIRAQPAAQGLSGLASGAGQLQRMKRRNRRKAEDVLAKHRPGQRALARGAVRAGAEPHRMGHGSGGHQGHCSDGERERGPRHRIRHVAVGRPPRRSAAIVASMTVAISRFIGRAAVVTRA